VKFIKSVRLGWYAHVERIQNPKKTKTICNGHDGTSKKARPRNRWRDKVQENVEITGIKTSRQLSKTVENGG
jgi:hypothetical protein